MPSAARAGTSRSLKQRALRSVSSRANCRAFCRICSLGSPGRVLDRQPGGHPPDAPGDADAEELVHAAGEDGGEPDPLEQRHVLVLGQLENALAEPQPAILPVEVPIGRQLAVEHVRPGLAAAPAPPGRRPWTGRGPPPAGASWSARAQPRARSPPPRCGQRASTRRGAADSMSLLSPLRAHAKEPRYCSLHLGSGVLSLTAPKARAIYPVARPYARRLAPDLPGRQDRTSGSPGANQIRPGTKPTSRTETIMRIGTSIAEPTGADALDKLADQLRAAADDGFSSAWMSNIFGLEALTALAVAGSRVPGLELGTAVIPTYPRHPAVLAQQALTTDLAVGGRLALGIGLSHQIVIQDMYGYSFERPARHMREYLAVLAPLLAGDPVAFEGETVQAKIGLSVPRSGHKIPLLLAALAPQMLRLAGSLADGTVLWMTGPATVRDHIVPSITKAAAEAGRPSPAGGLRAAGVRHRLTRTRPGSAPARRSRSTGNCRPTGRCSTGKARPGPATSRLSATRTPSPRSSGRWPTPASRTSWPVSTPAARTGRAPGHFCERSSPSSAEPARGGAAASTPGARPDGRARRRRASARIQLVRASGQGRDQARCEPVLADGASGHPHHLSQPRVPAAGLSAAGQRAAAGGRRGQIVARRHQPGRRVQPPDRRRRPAQSRPAEVGVPEH